MIKEIKLQRIKNDIIRYLSNLSIIIRPYNTYYGKDDYCIIDKIHSVIKIEINRLRLANTLPSDIDYDIFIEMVNEYINIENYEIIFDN